MNKGISIKVVQLLMLALPMLMINCHGPAIVHQASEIEAAMKKYDAFILHTDADSIAMMYTKNGKLGVAATGRDSIRAFLRRLSGMQVLTQSSVTDSIRIEKDTAWQQGHYQQSDIVHAGDTAHVKGKYQARWVWSVEEGWRLDDMSTSPE